MRSILIGALLLTATFAVPAAAAASTCGHEETAGTEFYVVASTGRVTVWNETNGEDGLQRNGCTDDEGNAVGRDNQVFDTGVITVRCPIPGVPNICLF